MKHRATYFRYDLTKLPLEVISRVIDKIKLGWSCKEISSEMKLHRMLVYTINYWFYKSVD